MPNLTDQESWRGQWDLRAGVTYLNHGSFGPPPRAVQAARQAWQAELDRQPMDFFVRKYEPAWFATRQALAAFVGADARNLAFVENATSGMNVVANSFSLRPGDEVLLTDQEYGAVLRIWQRACGHAGAEEPRVVQLPLPVESADQVVDGLFAGVTPRTRLIVVSHITSPTAITLPVAPICAEARRRGHRGLRGRSARRGAAAAGTGSAGLRFLLRQLPQVAERAVRLRFPLRLAGPSCRHPPAAAELGTAGTAESRMLVGRVHLERHA